MTPTAKIVTTTHKLVVEVPEERVHLDLSMKEARLIAALVNGITTNRVASRFGLNREEHIALWESLRDVGLCPKPWETLQFEITQ
jgi:hypothetical protein